MKLRTGLRVVVVCAALMMLQAVVLTFWCESASVLSFRVEGLDGLACERHVETAAESVAAVRQARARSDLGVLEVFADADAETEMPKVIEAVEATGHWISACAAEAL